MTVATPDGEKPTMLEEGHVFAIRPVTGDVGPSGRRFRMWLGDTCVATPGGGPAGSASTGWS